MTENQNTTPASRVIFVRSPYPPMSEEQLRAALGGLEESDPVWRAFHQLLDRELASAMLDASDAQLDPRKGTHPGGRVASLAELKKQLFDYREAPVKREAPEFSPRNTRKTRK